MKKPQPLHEYFSQYTSAEILHIQENVCKKNKCKYLKSRKMGGVTYCDYLCMTKTLRDCMPDVCTHYNDDVTVRKVNINNALFDNKDVKKKKRKKTNANTESRTKKERSSKKTLRSDVS